MVLQAVVSKMSALIKLLKFSCCGGVAPSPSTSCIFKAHLLLARAPTRWWALLAPFFGREISHRLRHDSFPKPDFFFEFMEACNFEKALSLFLSFLLWGYTLIQSLMRTPGRVAELCSLGALQYLPIKFKALYVALCYQTDTGRRNHERITDDLERETKGLHSQFQIADVQTPRLPLWMNPVTTTLTTRGNILVDPIYAGPKFVRLHRWPWKFGATFRWAGCISSDVSVIAVSIDSFTIPVIRRYHRPV